MPLSELRRYRDPILKLASSHGARNVRIFGSVARGDERSDSDIDFLVEMERSRSVLDVIGLQQDLEELLGRRVEVFTDGDLSPYMLTQVLTEAASL